MTGMYLPPVAPGEADSSEIATAVADNPDILRRKGVFRRLLADPTAVVSMVVLAVIVLAAIFAPLLTSADPTESSLMDGLGPAAPGHPLGFDGIGYDVWARLLYGARNSLLGTLFATAIAVAIGVPAGLLAGYYQGAFDAVASWISNLLQAVPAIILLLVVLAAIGQNTYVAMGVFGILMSTGVYRLIRASVTAVREELYVDAARVSGLPDSRIVRRHILPVVIAPTVIQTAGMLGVGILIQSGLEFLGLGSKSEPSWGSMLNDAFANIYTKPELLIWPSLALVLTVTAFSLLGNSLSDVLVGGRPKVVKRAKGSSLPTVADNPSTPLGELTGSELLVVEGLRVAYPKAGGGASTVVDGVSLTVSRGEVLGLVGESGSGKSQTAFAIMGLLPPEAHTDITRMVFEGTDLAKLSGSERNALRGKRIAYIPQEPMSNLDPSFKIGSQLIEPVRHHLGLSKADAKKRVLDLLDRVGINDPKKVYNSYPHEISGGMAQRVLIAGAVSCDPDLLIADEPTTALDVTVQAEVLDLMRSLDDEFDMGMILVTHDFGVVADICDRIAVMQAGKIVEMAPAEQLFADPQHPYTKMLLASTLEDAEPREPLGSQPETPPATSPAATEGAGNE
ncbi:MAG TPA: dipeptide/oligopeptide/nickel ABC transporter permease/ATP-binding protein [Propionicimonas sp.]|nr:dipeptide/oligopeptide/nickel ABC transporter permease/ATP-binding protein [Propionicimonas sp.]HRA06364.1 dipeptide/oligopeptide/nickel ABC transporter permease/ATP-binding protein [Propionicimonas sp.]